MGGRSLEVRGATDLPACNGVYRIEEGRSRNGRSCFSKAGGGAIYYDGSHWKICQTGSGSSESGWNFSQAPTDGGSLPPLGRWRAAARIPSEVTRDYSMLEIKVVLDGVAVGDIVTTTNAKIGMIVARGPDWKWGDQDGNSTGVVIEVDDDGWVRVEWHKGGKSNKYRATGPYDLRVASVAAIGIVSAHDGIMCDVCGVRPIEGIRFTKLDSDWDACCGCYAKLAPAEKTLCYAISDSRIRAGSHVAARDAKYGWCAPPLALCPARLVCSVLRA